MTMNIRTAISAVSLSLCFALVSACFAGGADGILGVWNNEEKDARIEVLKCGDTYCGKIIWLKEPNYPAGSTEGTPGTPWLDNHNPDRARRARPILGLQIVRDFVFVRDSLWKGGTVYDPKNGKAYSGKIVLVSPEQLDLRGYIGIPLLGRTTTWTRYVQNAD
jgi:uncharacterized protein (DUF2147 family)